MCEHPRYGKLVQDVRFETGEIVRRIQFLSERDSAKYDFNPSAFPDVLRIPCGKCLACRLKHSRDWSLRCMCEAKMHDSNQFWTLTFDDEFLPKDFSVSRLELSKFVRCIRDYFRSDGFFGIRYFGCGEYGSRNMRPHYHLLMFNCPEFPDLVPLFKNKMGQQVYSSDTLSRLWGKGLCSIGAVTLESAGYVARYAMKKADRGFALPSYLTPEFISMSNRPGIGSEFLDKYVSDIYQYDEIVLEEGKVFKPPRYFDRKARKLLGDDFIDEVTKRRSEAAIAAERDWLEYTGLFLNAKTEQSKLILDSRVKPLTRPI